MLYLHKNNIQDFVDTYKLRKLNKLRTLTLHNNPMCGTPCYRNTVIHFLPNLRKLDNVVVVRSEREQQIKTLDKDVRIRLTNAYPEDFNYTLESTKTRYWYRRHYFIIYLVWLYLMSQKQKNKLQYFKKQKKLYSLYIISYSYLLTFVRYKRACFMCVAYRLIIFTFSCHSFPLKCYVIYLCNDDIYDEEWISSFWMIDWLMSNFRCVCWLPSAYVRPLRYFCCVKLFQNVSPCQLLNSSVCVA